MTTTETITLVSVCTSGLIGIGGVAIGLLSQWMNYQSRKHHYHQQLWAAQKEAIVRLYPLLMAQFHWMSESRKPVNPEDQTKRYEELQAILQKLNACLNDWSLFLPQSILGDIGKTCDIAASQLLEIGTPQKKAMRELEISMQKLINGFREHIGTDNLTSEFLPIIGPDTTMANIQAVLKRPT